MAFIEIDETLFPVIVFKLTGESTLEEHQTHLKSIESLMEKSYESFVLVMDLSHAHTSSRDIKASSVRWIEHNRILLEENLLEMIFVHQSVVTSNFMKSIFDIKPLPIPNRISPNLAEGILWAKQRVKLISA